MINALSSCVAAAQFTFDDGGSDGASLFSTSTLATSTLQSPQELEEQERKRKEAAVQQVF